MALSKRLQFLIEQIEPTNWLCDIGSDHGLLCIEAIKQNKAQFCIAADINQKPLEKAQSNIEKARCDDRVFTVLSDGAQNIDLDCDTWVIAGMGAELIIKILEDSKSKAIKVKQILLSPHTRVELLRAYLYSNGFEIKNEVLFLDNKYYPILNIYYSGKVNKYSLYDIHIGKLKNDPLFKKWIAYQNQRYQSLAINNSKYIEVYQLFNQEFVQNQFQES